MPKPSVLQEFLGGGRIDADSPEPARKDRP